MPMFCVWNRNYKLAYVAAADIDAALTLATEKGHLKRPTGYRKWREYDPAQNEPLPELAQGLLDRGESGVVSTNPPNTDWYLV